MTNIDEIINNIFGSDFQNLFVLQPKEEDDTTSTRTQQVFKEIDNFIEFETSPLEENDATINENNIGRIGPKVVTFDTSAHSGYFLVSHDRLDLNSQRNFSTIRANTGVYKGKWIYELQLGTKGVMQVGWCTIHCKFNEESGVGDTKNSYAYDGNRVKKWNASTHKYGEPWLSGDIISCAIDADEGTIDFYRNGQCLGRAFENICLGSGIAYFPAVSLTYAETLKANFGNVPLRYPVEGYQTLQATPVNELRKATFLIKCFSNLIFQMESIRSSNESLSVFEDTSMTVHSFVMCIARSVMKHLGPLLKIPYIVDAVFVPFLEEHLAQDVNDSKTERPHLMLMLDLIWTFFKPNEIKLCLEATAIHLLSTFRHNPLGLEYPNQCRSLVLLMSLCRHTATRQHLLQHALFHHRIKFANFLHIEPLNDCGLEQVIDKIWWETNPVDATVECNKKAYFAACEKIQTSTGKLEALQVELLVTLLDNTDGTDKLPSSRAIFLQKFRSFIYDNFDNNPVLQTDQAHVTPLPITLCCFHRLLVTFRVLWDIEIGTNPVYIPCRTFYDNTIRYYGIERLGGVFSHLQKTYKSDLTRLLGQGHEVLKTSDYTEGTGNNSTLAETARPLATSMIHPTLARIINLTGPARPLFIELRLPFERNPPPPGPANPTMSLIELLDGIILLYHVSAKKQIAKIASLIESVNEYIAAIADIKSRLERAKKMKSAESKIVLEELTKSDEIFNERLSKESRYMAWIRASIYSQEKQLQLSWLLKTVTLTLRAASEEGNMFSFVPDFYLKALVDLYVGIHNHIHPTVPIENIAGYQEMLNDVAHFLCDHYMDPRIVIASAKDKLTIALCQIVSSPLTVKVLENVPIESRLKMVSNLLKPYENRAWAQSNIVLLRFWRGSGFAFRYNNSPHMTKKTGPRTLPVQGKSLAPKPCPSVVYQMHVKDILFSNPQATTNFLDSLLNQLNWAFSEFITMVQEIHNISTRLPRDFIESRQLRICATCFEFATSLLRVLEMIVTVAPNVFSDPTQSSGNLLPRLCQLLCQILNRMSSHTSCFQHVVQLDIPDLETVDHFPILSAVIGILLVLLKQDISTFNHSDEVPFVTKALLMEPSFQTSSLQYVLTDVSSNDTKTQGVRLFSFLNYKEDVSEEEIQRVQQLIEYLNQCRTQLPETNMIIDEENMCTICYAYPIAVTFKPCNHMSCKACIDRYLMISHECFFCKVTIDKVVDLSGHILHDFSSSNTNQSTIS